MKERIFIISSLPEDEEEEKFPYDEHGNTTAMAYYDERGNTIETDHQEQPEPATTTENRIIIIYEAPGAKVLPEQNQALEIMPTIPNHEEIPTTSPYPQPETYTAETHKPYEKFFAEYIHKQTVEEYREGKEPHKPYEKFFAYIHKQTVEEYREGKEIASIRNELQEIAVTAGTPTNQPGEIQAAA